jgi:molybdopterin synthase catalytic subunit
MKTSLQILRQNIEQLKRELETWKQAQNKEAHEYYKQGKVRLNCSIEP